MEMRDRGVEPRDGAEPRGGEGPRGRGGALGKGGVEPRGRRGKTEMKGREPGELLCWGERRSYEDGGRAERELDERRLRGGAKREGKRIWEKERSGSSKCEAQR